MTKLTEWLTVLAALLTTWWMLLTRKSDFTKANEHLILFAPIYAVLAFGASSAFIVFYRVFTFNDCNEAAAELKSEIAEATADLKKLGFNFRND